MPQPKSISPGKGREALRQKVQISRLQYGRLNRTYYSLLKLQAKFLRNSPTQSANSTKFAHFVNLFYIMFQAPRPNRERSEIPTNYANSVQFAHTVHELREIHTIC